MWVASDETPFTVRKPKFAKQQKLNRQRTLPF